MRVECETVEIEVLRLSGKMENCFVGYRRETKTECAQVLDMWLQSRHEPGLFRIQENTENSRQRDSERFGDTTRQTVIENDRCAR